MVNNSRSYSRVNTYMPFDIRVISPSESNIRSRISNEDAVLDSFHLPEILDKHLYQWLSTINAKLDMLLQVHNDEFCTMSFRPLNISASGMKFVSRDRYELGDQLEIKIVLHVNPHKIMYLVAEVIRVEQVSFRLNSYNIAVKFIDLTDEIKRELLEYDFRKQKEVLSKRKRAQS